MIDTPDLSDVHPPWPERPDPGPTTVRASFYEERKLATVLASLSQPRYRHVWDAACGTGELAARLAGRADELLATDSTVQAVRLARSRCHDLPQVHVHGWELPAAPPDLAGLDLVVLSEIAYHLTEPERAALVSTLDAVAGDDAEVVALHWRYRPHDATLSGEEVETELVDRLTALGWRHRVQHDDEDFVLDSLERHR